MPKSIVLRAEAVPDRLVALRMGINTISDNALARACGDAYDEWGIHAFSVLELPDGDWEQLAMVMPIVRKRPKALIAAGRDHLAAGFPLLPTRGRLHWSVLLSEPTTAQFFRVRRHFSGPVDVPVWDGR